ncbi:MAG: hypothetical protein IPH05_18610 [Flavobacteriales bacterium]|jgi:hypothetical protein|nr:hypothetical protein [Flavobacteriales bacterium]MBK7483288.1 hypothetical protein [Flavobacteriales bacterium]
MPNKAISEMNSATHHQKDPADHHLSGLNNDPGSGGLGTPGMLAGIHWNEGRAVGEVLQRD